MRDRKVKRQTTAERKRGGNSPAARRAAAKAKVSSRPAASRFTKVERNPIGSQFGKPKAPKADKSKLTNPSKKRMKEGQHIFKTDDLDYIARRTYLASVRFMRIAHLFKYDSQHILQVDCDTVLRNGFFQNEFQDLTRHVCVMPKPKDPSVFIASAICLGTGQNGIMFRELFSKRMIEAFEKEIYWYVDQDVLRNVMREWNTEGRPWGNIPYKWNAWGQKRHDIFSTGKGDKKNDKRFKSAQLNWLPPHWKEKIYRELRDLPENIEL